MATVGIAPNGPASNPDGTPTPVSGLVPVFSADRSCIQEVEQILKDYASVIEDVIVPKNIRFWELYWSSWPYSPKIPDKDTPEVQRYIQLLHTIRGLVDTMLGFHICFAGVLLWVLTALVFQVILIFVECTDCELLPNARTTMAVATLCTLLGILFILTLWNRNRLLSDSRKKLLALLLILAHIFTIIRMILPASSSTVLFRILCLRAIGEIPLVSQQNLLTGWVRKFILDFGKMLVMILQLKLGKDDIQSGFSVTLLLAGLPLYLLSFVAGFNFEKADIILKKKYAVGVERLSERIFQLLLTLSRFGGEIPDKVHQVSVPKQMLQPLKRQNSTGKTYPLVLKGNPKLSKDAATACVPSDQKQVQVPEDSARPLKRLTPPKKIMHLHPADGLAKLNLLSSSAEPSVQLGKLTDTSVPQHLKPLQKRQLSHLALNRPVNKGPMNSRRLVSLELDSSPKFGPIPEESSQTYNSPIPRTPTGADPGIAEVHNNYCPNRQHPDPWSDITKDYFLGELTHLEVWLGDKRLQDKHPNSVDSLALDSLSDKFRAVIKKGREANFWISTAHLEASLGVCAPETALMQALGGINSEILNWAQEEMNYLFRRTHEDFTLVFSELYSRKGSWMQTVPKFQVSPTFGSKSSGDGHQENDGLQMSRFPALVVNPALLRFRSMSITDNGPENQFTPGSITNIPSSRLLVHASYSQADAVWKVFVKVWQPAVRYSDSKDAAREMDPPGNLSPIKLTAPKSAFHLPNHLTPDIQPAVDSRVSNTRVYNIKDSVITLGAKSQTDDQRSGVEITPKKSSLKQSHSSIGGVPSLGPGPFTKAVGAFEDFKKDHHQPHRGAYANRARTESVDEVYFCDFRNAHTVGASMQKQVHTLEFSGVNGESGIQTQPNSKKRVQFSENGGHLTVPKTKSHPTTPREVMSPKFANEARRGDVSGTSKKGAFQFDPAELKQLHMAQGSPESKHEKALLTPPTPGAVNPVSPPTSSLKNFQSNYEDIVAMVVHDMRSPLGCIIGNLELIDSELRESLQKIQNNSSVENRTPSAMGGSYAARSHNSINMTTLGLPNHPLASLYVLLSPLIKSSKSATTLLETLVNDMLDAARISKGIFRVSTEDVDVRKVVQECLDTVGIAAKAKRLNLSYQIDGCPRILSDHQRIKQVLLNFLSNSIKFTPNNGSVKIRVEDWGGKTLRWTVEDNGEGIRPEHMSKMFEKFQSDRASRSNSKGIGLGLYICKNIIEALGPKGCISVSSEPRVSTKISFDLYKDMTGKAVTQDTTMVKASKEVHTKADLAIAPKRVMDITNSATELEGETKRSKLLDVKSPRIGPKSRDVFAEGRAGIDRSPNNLLKDRTADTGSNGEKGKQMNPALTHSQKNDIFRLTDAGVAVSKRIIEVRLRTGRNHKFSLVEGQSQLGDAHSYHERSVKSFHQYRPRNEPVETRTKQELVNSDNLNPRTAKTSMVRGGLSDDEGSHNQDENKTVHKCESIMQASINLCPTPNDSNNASRQEFNSIAKKGLNNSLVDSSKIFNVLIVEDEPTLMELYGHFCARFSELKKFPVEFLQATSLEDGLRVISQVPLDVIITDFSLPDGNGLQLAREIDNYSDSCKPLLILASGERSFDPQRTHEISQRFFQVMHKPISMKLWMQTLEECLGEIRHRDTQVLASLSPRFPANYSEDSGNDTETEKNF